MKMFSPGRGNMNYWIIPKVITIIVICFSIPYILTTYIMRRNKDYPNSLKGTPYEL